MVACTRTDARETTAVAKGDASAVDPAKALALTQFLTDEYLNAHGSCLTTSLPGAQSQIRYVMLPSDTGYFRLNVVVSSDRSRIDKVDFVRGPRMWSATYDRTSSSLIIESFASQSDPAPLVTRLPATGAESDRLQALAQAALQVPCRGGDERRR